METFQCGTRIVAGEGAVKVLREYGAKRVFVVTDPYFFKNGMAQTPGRPGPIRRNFSRM